jgi:flavin reductase (DIM6/NTAB) family NADH-FMN oxidoreductase RutF
MPVGRDLFCDILASFPAGVTVVSAFAPDGAPRGLTVSAFCSVSPDPPLVLVCIDKSSQTLPAILQTGGFTVTILSAGWDELALRFAGKAADKFNGVRWVPPEVPGTGPVLVDAACAYAACRVDSVIEAGDHVVFLARVEEGRVWESRSPLLYFRRSFANWPVSADGQDLGEASPPSGEKAGWPGPD